MLFYYISDFKNPMQASFCQTMRDEHPLEVMFQTERVGHAVSFQQCPNAED